MTFLFYILLPSKKDDNLQTDPNNTGKISRVAQPWRKTLPWLKSGVSSCIASWVDLESEIETSGNFYSSYKKSTLFLPNNIITVKISQRRYQKLDHKVCKFIMEKDWSASSIRRRTSRRYLTPFLERVLLKRHSQCIKQNTLTTNMSLLCKYFPSHAALVEVKKVK